MASTCETPENPWQLSEKEKVALDLKSYSCIVEVKSDYENGSSYYYDQESDVFKEITADGTLHEKVSSEVESHLRTLNTIEVVSKKDKTINMLKKFHYVIEVKSEYDNGSSYYYNPDDDYFFEARVDELGPIIVSNKEVDANLRRLNTIKAVQRVKDTHEYENELEKVDSALQSVKESYKNIANEVSVKSKKLNKEFSDFLEDTT